jgi:hypothetical protein
MLQEPHSLLVNELSDHITENGANSVESLVGLTDVLQSHVIEQDLLNDEDSNGLAELRSSLHDTEAERNDLGGQEEIDDFCRVILDQSADDSKRRQAEVFKGPRL